MATYLCSYKHKLQNKTNFQVSFPGTRFFILYSVSVNSFAPVLNKLTLGYCDKVNDVHLAEIVAVCRGTLVIEDYYGQ